MTGLFVAQAFDLFVLGQPIATFKRIFEAAQSFSQRHAAVSMEIVSGTNNITRPGYRKTVRACFLQSDCHCIGFAVEQQRPHSVDSAQSHASRSTGCENAVRQFFPKPRIRSIAPNFLKLTESLPNFF